ncbi:MAG: hypothetical protein KDD58_09340 [Bdellovibrionales bacterium]|nr:hypothetical protein [Bdellovibrionales bacterium]
MKTILIVSTLFLSACASPRIYIIDRQTVMEAEASGHWPQIDVQALRKGQKAGATFFPKSQNLKKEARLQNVLNGEISK